MSETRARGDTTDATKPWNLIGFITSSKYRMTVVEELDRRPKTPSTMADDADVAISHISRALRELRERDLVELLVPEERSKGRIYALTDQGEAVHRARLDAVAGDGGDER